MKRGTPRHPKLRRLAVLLGVQQFEAVGKWAVLLDYVAEYAPTGDVTDHLDVVAPDCGEADVGRFTEALVTCRLLDRMGDRLLVHDWSEHAEDSIHARLACRGERFADGTAPSTRRLNSRQRAKANARLTEAQTPTANGVHVAQRPPQQQTPSAPVAQQPQTGLQVARVVPILIPNLNLNLNPNTPLPPKGGGIDHAPPLGSPTTGPPTTADSVTPADRFAYRGDTDAAHALLPPRARRNRTRFATEFIAAMGRSGLPPSELSARLAAYLESPEGRGKFFREPARWLAEDGWTESTDAWQGRDSARCAADVVGEILAAGGGA